MAQFSFSEVAGLTAENWLGLFVPEQRIFVLYLLTAFGIAWFVWRAETREKGVEPRGFLSYLFPASVYGHRSSWQDYFIFFANGLLYYGIIAQFLLSERPFAILVHEAALSFFGPLEQPLLSGIAMAAAFTLASALLYDFAVYCAHYLTHKVPALWAFHKVHHSAEVLTPITLFRMHPVDLFLNAILLAVFAGAGIGLFSYLAMEPVTDIKVLGVNVIVFAFYVGGYNLRHSHVWLHYPRWMSSILISPAQHQIHHSVDPRHMDKNLGVIFSFWDRMFGTLYEPEGREEIVFGVNRKERNPYSTMNALYLRSFAECFGLLRERFSKGGGAWIDAGAMSAYAGIALFLYLQLGALADASLSAPPSVHIEELTWTEVRHAQEAGYDAVIIPTGGTEQNGPHLALGKHNYIVRHAAGEIARQLGGTLAAPVVAYVPEGAGGQGPTENAYWPGTVGVPPRVLEDTLYWAATSFRNHGFKYIFFIGDHALSQEPQRRVADRLSREWKKEGVTVAHVGDYYGPANGQVQWLQQEKGLSEQAIGTHAGVRDTSELMFVHPEGVRSTPMMVEGMADGVQGDPGLASKEIGRKMIELKIQSAVGQMRRIRPSRHEKKTLQQGEG